MELNKEQLETIANRLCTLATYCNFMYDEAILASRLIGVYAKSSYEVVDRLHYVLRFSDNLLENLRSVSAFSDSLLIRERTLDDAEVSDV